MNRVIIVGTNDAATATAIRLFRAGFNILLISPQTSFDLHYFRNFSPVIMMGSKEIEGVTARSYADFIYHEQSAHQISLNDFVSFVHKNRQICIVTANDFKSIKSSDMDYYVICDAELFISLKMPDNAIQISCVDDLKNNNYQISINRHDCGIVKYPFNDITNFKKSEEEDLAITYSKKEGLFVALKSPADKCLANEKIALIDNEALFAESPGYLEGILQSGHIVPQGCPLFSISKKAITMPKLLPPAARLISGGVLEAIMFDKNLNTH